ncbi:universal stress protein [Nocardioides ferulae]|uniref:universal stress protein n=1 Tax=Nocardioides ferulae TaxID=2340821 RepID=UPI000EB4E947|nr:universal stress protein [Nocardioides ferulae]
MLTTKPRKILVALGPNDAVAATAFAAQEAGRRGCGVHLVHVVSKLVGDAAGEVRITDDQLSNTGYRVLADAARRLEHQLPAELPVTTELVFGPVVRTLAEMSARASMVVLQRRSHRPLERLISASVTHGLVARAHAPVVSVPEGWQAETDSGAAHGDEAAHDVLVEMPD